MTKRFVSHDDQKPGTGLPDVVETALNATYPPNTATATRVPLGTDFQALQDALILAENTGETVVYGGSITTDQTLHIRSACDLSRLSINYTGTGTAVVVENPASVASLALATIRLPKVKCSTKPPVGSGWAAGTVGVKLTNVNTSEVHVTEVRDFETNLLVFGDNGGTVHSTIVIGSLWNGRTNLKLDRANSGWVNQNVFLAGRLSHHPSEGTAVAGVRHIHLAEGYAFNGNTFIGTSVEGSVAQWTLDVQQGSSNEFTNLRWEGTPTVRWGASAGNNRISGGYLAQNITVTNLSTVQLNTIQAPSRFQLSGQNANGVMHLANTLANANPVVVVYNQNDLDGEWRWKIGAGQIEGRGSASSHTYPTLRLDPGNRRIQWGTGTATAPEISLGMFGSTGLALNGGSFFFSTDGTQDIGSPTNYRPRDVNAARYVRVGSIILRDNAGVLEKSTNGTTWTAV